MANFASVGGDYWVKGIEQNPRKGQHVVLLGFTTHSLTVINGDFLRDGLELQLLLCWPFVQEVESASKIHISPEFPLLGEAHRLYNPNLSPGITLREPYRSPSRSL